MSKQVPQKGDIWRHTKSGGEYEIIGSAFNTITDVIDLMYKPIISDPDFDMFTRQLLGHKKAFISKNEDGTPRFEFVETMAQRTAAIEAMFDGDGEDDTAG